MMLLMQQRNSRGWAVGSTTEPLSGWSSTNNSKYYSEQASNSETEAEAFAAQSSRRRDGCRDCKRCCCWFCH